MLSRIFPKQFDNTYRGHWLGLWLFVPMMLLKATQGVNSVIMTRDIMTGADGIPLDTFNAAAADTAVALFAILGLFTLLLPLIGVVALIRYRAMIPFLFLMFLLVQLGSRAIQMLHPIVRSTDTAMGYAGHPIGFYINLGILALTVIGFVLSLQNRQPLPAKV